MSRRSTKAKAPILYQPTIFNCYKPRGVPSSFVLNFFKRNLPQGFGKIGHFGTLDPFADGVYLIGVAGAQKLNDLVHGHLRKTYVATGMIGSKTDSGDCDGNIVREIGPSPTWDHFISLSHNELEETLRAKFCEMPYQQRPPMYSAAKHLGRPLYEYARQGEFVDKAAVPRQIFHLEVLEKSKEQLSFRVEVSSGTYIRTLFEDILDHFGLIGHLTALTREAIGPLNIKDSLTQERWPTRDQEIQALPGLNIQQVLPFKVAVLDQERGRLFNQGVSLRVDQCVSFPMLPSVDTPFWVASQSDDTILGLAHLSGDQLKISINFPSISH